MRRPSAAARSSRSAARSHTSAVSGEPRFRHHSPCLLNAARTAASSCICPAFPGTAPWSRPLWVAAPSCFSCGQVRAEGGWCQPQAAGPSLVRCPGKMPGLSGAAPPPGVGPVRRDPCSRPRGDARGGTAAAARPTDATGAALAAPHRAGAGRVRPGCGEPGPGRCGPGPSAWACWPRRSPDTCPRCPSSSARWRTGCRPSPRCRTSAPARHREP